MNDSSSDQNDIKSQPAAEVQNPATPEHQNAKEPGKNLFTKLGDSVHKLRSDPRVISAANKAKEAGVKFVDQATPIAKDMAKSTVDAFQSSINPPKGPQAPYLGAIQGTDLHDVEFYITPVTLSFAKGQLVSFGKSQFYLCHTKGTDKARYFLQNVEEGVFVKHDIVSHTQQEVDIGGDNSLGVTEKDRFAYTVIDIAI